jgi:hypothetical protein
MGAGAAMGTGAGATTGTAAAATSDGFRRIDRVGCELIKNRFRDLFLCLVGFWRGILCRAGAKLEVHKSKVRPQCVTPL